MNNELVTNKKVQGLAYLPMQRIFAVFPPLSQALTSVEMQTRDGHVHVDNISM